MLSPQVQSHFYAPGSEASPTNCGDVVHYLIELLYYHVYIAARSIHSQLLSY